MQDDGLGAWCRKQTEAGARGSWCEGGGSGSGTLSPSDPRAQDSCRGLGTPGDCREGLGCTEPGLDPEGMSLVPPMTPERDGETAKSRERKTEKGGPSQGETFETNEREGEPERRRHMFPLKTLDCLK